MMQNLIKQANTDHSIQELLAVRYSPYTFAPRLVETQKLLLCLEAARWAASSFNEQPWSFLVAPRQQAQEFEKMQGCLVEANQSWAANAGVLILTVVSKTFTGNNKPNRVAEHDLGLAAANLTVQATALGLAVHQMAGVNLTKARQTYQIPDSFEPFTVIALGYAGDPARTQDPVLAERDQTPRSRKPLQEFVFFGAWQQSAQDVLGRV